MTPPEPGFSWHGRLGRVNPPESRAAAAPQRTAETPVPRSDQRPGVKNTATAFGLFLDLAERHLAEIVMCATGK